MLMRSTSPRNGHAIADAAMASPVASRRTERELRMVAPFGSVRCPYRPAFRVPRARRQRARLSIRVLASHRLMIKLRSVRVPVFYDFSSTICYFTHRVLGRLGPELDELGVTLD